MKYQSKLKEIHDALIPAISSSKFIKLLDKPNACSYSKSPGGQVLFIHDPEKPTISFGICEKGQITAYQNGKSLPKKELADAQQHLLIIVEKENLIEISNEIANKNVSNNNTLPYY